MNHQEFWNDNEVAQKILQENKHFKETVDEYNKLKELDLQEKDAGCPSLQMWRSI